MHVSWATSLLVLSLPFVTPPPPLNLIKLSLIAYVFLLNVIKQAALERPFLGQQNSSFALV